MNNILITSAGQRVSLVRAFQAELKKLFPHGKVFTVDLNPKLAPACHVSDGYENVPRITDDQYIAVLLDICQRKNIQLIIPTIDTELQILAEHRHLFLQHNITPIISDKSFIDICRDKRLTNDFFQKNGITIPKSMCKDNLSFPLFIKPFDGSLSKDIFVIHTASELNDYHLNHPKLMFMEYIDHNEYDEYTVDCYYNKSHKLCCAIPRQRIFVRAGEINKGVTHKNEIVTFLKDKLRYIEGAIGCLTMQFFFHPHSKNIIGIEINPRFGGGFPLSYQAGGNYPAWLIKEYLLQQTISYTDSWEDNLLMLRYDDEILVKNYHD